MKQWKSVDEVLDFAIIREEEAAQFYNGLAAKAEKDWMRKLFEDFAREEMGHKAKLQGIKKGKMLAPVASKVVDLKIGDYLVDVEATADMDYQQTLIVAMKKEKAAFKLYTALAEQVEDAGLQQTFLSLAQEEAKHKLRFELEYDDHILQEN